MEEKKADEMEMAEKTPEKRKAQEKAPKRKKQIISKKAKNTTTIFIN